VIARHARGSAIAVFVLAVFAACSTSAAPGPTRSPSTPTAPARTDTSGPASPGPTGLDKLQHLVFIVQENRSFDQYFGTYPGAKGFPRNAQGQITACVPNPFLGGCSRPYHATGWHQLGGPHDQEAAAIDIDGGRMDGFVRAMLPGPHCWTTPTMPECKGEVGPQGQPDTLSYMNAADIPNYWAYAHHFVLQDHMFAPTDSSSLPSHLFMLSAWSAYCSNPMNAATCVNDNALTTPGSTWRFGQNPLYGWTDITYLLDKMGVSWRYYVDNRTCLSGQCPNGNHGDSADKAPLGGFVDVHQDGSDRNIQTLSHFMTAAKNGTLPSVSWIAVAPPYNEHPGFPGTVRSGMAFTTNTINAVMRSPNWDSSAVFLYWDDWGGFYDNVVPPQVDLNGYGLRVPSLIISPYAKQGYVDHQTLSFDAFLKLIEDRFLNGARLNPKTDGRPDPRPTVRENVNILGDLRDDFDFHQSPRPPFVLDPTP
jgi:phospholipase C